ncbi:putative ribonuclease H-like domain-containing protein [Tanacetum coccineum]
MDNVRPRASYSPIKRSYYTKPAFRPKNLKQDVKTSGVKNMTTAGTRVVVNTGKGKMDNALKKSRGGNPEICLQDHVVVDSGYFSHMTGNKAYLLDYEDYNGGFVAFGSDPKGALKDDLEKLVTQEMIAKAMDDATRYAFEEEKKNIASTKRAAQATSINKLNIGSQSFNTANTPYVSAASTPTGANTGESSFVYLGGQIPIDTSTLPNADLPTDPNMPDLEDDSDVFSNEEEPKTISQALKDESWVEAMQEELLQFKLQKVWILVDLPSGKKEEGIDYDEVFAPVARIEAIRLFLAFASYMGFPVYQMDVKSAFLYGTIEEEVYVHQPPGFVDPAHPHKVYKDKYVADILKKFDFWSIRTATTPIEYNKLVVKDEDGIDVDVHVYRSMIGYLMYLTASRPDIMFAVCACARHQVTPKASYLNAVKRIFRYLKHQPKLRLWYPRDSPFELEACLDSDYGGAILDRKSTTGDCQFFGRRLISWQCKKQTIMANSTTEAEYVAAANCCGQVLWIQNQMMDYGFNFMNTKIHIDNESTISVNKNLVAHSRTKHIKIRFHFIRDCYKKRLIEVIKIHTDHNVADLLTKGFDVTRFNFLVDKHNMVALLKKPNESVGFTEIVDFLKGTSLRGYAREHVPLLLAMLVGVAEDQGEGSANPAEPNPIPIDPVPSTSQPSILSTTEPPQQPSPPRKIDRHETEIPQSQMRQPPQVSYESPLHEGHTSGSAEDSLQLKELMVLVPKLVARIDNLEKELHHTKNTYGKTVLTLVERVKSLEVALKRKTKKVVVSEDEETENQGRKIQDIDDDPLVSLVRESMEEKVAELIWVSPGRVIISSGSAGVNTGSTPVSTPSIVQKVNVIISSLVKGQREGKAPMSTEDDEEAKRKDEVQEATQHYSEEDWDNIRAKLEANAELVKDVLGENVTSDDFAKRMNQGTWKPTQLKKLTFVEIKEEFEKLVRSIEIFVPKYSKIEKTRVKRAGIELQKESSKKQKTIGIKEESAAEPVVAKEEEIEEQIKKRGKRKKQKARKGIHADKTAQQEVEEDMESLVKGNDTYSSSGTDIPISAVLVAIKPPSIANWKIIKLGKKGVYQIIREDGTYTTYINFGAMLKSISRDDLTELYRLVMQRVHCLNLESVDIYMLTERRYPLPADVSLSIVNYEFVTRSCNGVEKDCLSVGLATTQQIVISSPCLTDIKELLSKSIRLFGTRLLKSVDVDSLPKT